eukprot:3110329-Pyramimonas_sp.AAC.1
MYAHTPKIVQRQASLVPTCHASASQHRLAFYGPRGIRLRILDNSWGLGSMRNTGYYCLSHVTDFYYSAVLFSHDFRSGSGIGPAPFGPCPSIYP